MYIVNRFGDFLFFIYIIVEEIFFRNKLNNFVIIERKKIGFLNVDVLQEEYELYVQCN